MNYKKMIWLPLLLAAFAGCKGGAKDKNAKKETPPVSVDVLVAGMINFPNTMQVNGSVVSENMVSLYPEISGRITQLNLPDGQFVKKGTLLVKIFDEDLQAELEQQNVALDLAQKTEKRLKQLLAVNGIDQATYDASLNEMNTREANIKFINAQIEKTVINAPFDGTLGLRQVSLGAVVSSQTLLGTLSQTDKIKIDFTVPEAYDSIMQVGDTVIVQKNTSDQELTAIIRAIEPQISTSTRNVKVRAYLQKGNLPPGTFVKVSLVQNKSAIAVPSNAVIPDALSNQLVIVKNGKATFKNVETGNRNADMIEIKSGINPGDSIVISGVLFVRPGGKVKVKVVKKNKG